MPQQTAPVGKVLGNQLASEVVGHKPSLKQVVGRKAAAHYFCELAQLTSVQLAYRAAHLCRPS